MSPPTVAGPAVIVSGPGQPPPDIVVLASPSPAPSPSGPGAGFVSPPPPVAAWLIDAAHWAAGRPWLLAVAAALLVVWVAGRNLLDGWRHARHAADARLITIAPPPEAHMASTGRRTVAAAAAIVAVINVVYLASAAPAQAIIYGNTMLTSTGANPLPSVVQIFSDNGLRDSPGQNCTGTLISPTWVLTAQHCTYQDAGTGGPTRPPR